MVIRSNTVYALKIENSSNKAIYESVCWHFLHQLQFFIALDKVQFSTKKYWYFSIVPLYIFLISPWKHMLWVLIRSASEGASNEYHNICVLWRNMKNIGTFQLKGSIFPKNWHFIIQEKFNKLIYGIYTIIKRDTWQPVKFQLVSHSWNEMIFYRISELMLPTLIQRYYKKSFHFLSSSKTRDLLKFYRLSESLIDQNKKQKPNYSDLYFLRSFSFFHWFMKGSCQLLAKECARYWLTA